MSHIRKQLRYVTFSTAPGYRDLTLICRDGLGKECELRLDPTQVQRVIYACADVAKQIGAPHPPIDWEQYQFTIEWPNVTVWQAGPAKPAERRSA